LIGGIFWAADPDKPYVTAFGEKYATIIGNPPHLSPEQLRGESHLLDGRPPSSCTWNVTLEYFYLRSYEYDDLATVLEAAAKVGRNR
jgi:hypothetical protein